MDGKHVLLQSPINSGNDYDCYKMFPSIVLFALVDANYKFLYVDVGSKGRISDGGVFKNTNFYKKLEKKELDIPPPEILQIPYEIAVPYFILGDKAFALNDYTLKPYEGSFDAEVEGTVIPGRWRQDTEMSSMLPIQAIPRRVSTNIKERRSHLGRHFITNGALSWQNNYQ
ncbi:hypothetical protein ACJJTC_008514 [Scirpophaga incertulas]